MRSAAGNLTVFFDRMSLPTSLEIWAQTIEALCWQQITAFILAERGVRNTRLFLSGAFQPACFLRRAQLALNHSEYMELRYSEVSWGSGGASSRLLISSVVYFLHLNFYFTF